MNLKNNDGATTLVQPTGAPPLRVWALCISKTLEPIQIDRHRCSRTHLSEWPRKPITPDRYGLFHTAAGGLLHSQARGVNDGGRIGYHFLLFGVPLVLHGHQCRYFEYWLIHIILELLELSKTRIAPLHSQSDCMVERYIKSVEHLRKVVAPNQGDWVVKFPIFLLLYRARHYGLHAG
jgi:hypothetical protein